MNEFMQYIKEKNITKETANIYIADVKRFVLWYKTNTNENFLIEDFKSLTDFDFKIYINQLIKNNYSIKSINRYITSLNKLIKWLNDNQLNRLNKIKTLSCQNESNNRILSKHELKIFKDFIINTNKTRDILIFYFFLYSPIQIKELCNLKVEDINLEKKIIKVFKNNKINKILPLNKELYIVLKNYIKERKHNNPYNSSFLILGERTYKQVSRIAIYNLFKKYSDLLNMNITISSLKNICTIDYNL